MPATTVDYTKSFFSTVPLAGVESGPSVMSQVSQAPLAGVQASRGLPVSPVYPSPIAALPPETAKVETPIPDTGPQFVKGLVVNFRTPKGKLEQHVWTVGGGPDDASAQVKKYERMGYVVETSYTTQINRYTGKTQGISPKLQEAMMKKEFIEPAPGTPAYTLRSLPGGTFIRTETGGVVPGPAPSAADTAIQKATQGPSAISENIQRSIQDLSKYTNQISTAATSKVSTVSKASLIPTGDLTDLFKVTAGGGGVSGAGGPLGIGGVAAAETVGGAGVVFNVPTLPKMTPVQGGTPTILTGVSSFKGEIPPLTLGPAPKSVPPAKPVGISLLEAYGPTDKLSAENKKILQEKIDDINNEFQAQVNKDPNVGKFFKIDEIRVLKGAGPNNSDLLDPIVVPKYPTLDVGTDLTKVTQLLKETNLKEGTYTVYQNPTTGKYQLIGPDLPDSLAVSSRMGSYATAPLEGISQDAINKFLVEQGLVSVDYGKGVVGFVKSKFNLGEANISPNVIIFKDDAGKQTLLIKNLPMTEGDFRKELFNKQGETVMETVKQKIANVRVMKLEEDLQSKNLFEKGKAIATVTAAPLLSNYDPFLSKTITKVGKDILAKQPGLITKDISDIREKSLQEMFTRFGTKPNDFYKYRDFFKTTPIGSVTKVAAEAAVIAAAAEVGIPALTAATEGTEWAGLLSGPLSIQLLGKPLVQGTLVGLYETPTVVRGIYYKTPLEDIVPKITTDLAKFEALKAGAKVGAAATESLGTRLADWISLRYQPQPIWKMMKSGDLVVGSKIPIDVKGGQAVVDTGVILTNEGEILPAGEQYIVGTKLSGKAFPSFFDALFNKPFPATPRVEMGTELFRSGGQTIDIKTRIPIPETKGGYIETGTRVGALEREIDTEGIGWGVGRIVQEPFISSDEEFAIKGLKEPLKTYRLVPGTDYGEEIIEKGVKGQKIPQFRDLTPEQILDRFGSGGYATQEIVYDELGNPTGIVNLKGRYIQPTGKGGAIFVESFGPGGQGIIRSSYSISDDLQEIDIPTKMIVRGDERIVNELAKGKIPDLDVYSVKKTYAGKGTLDEVIDAKTGKLVFQTWIYPENEAEEFRTLLETAKGEQFFTKVPGVEEGAISYKGSIVDPFPKSFIKSGFEIENPKTLVLDDKSTQLILKNFPEFVQKAPVGGVQFVEGQPSIDYDRNAALLERLPVEKGLDYLQQTGIRRFISKDFPIYEETKLSKFKFSPDDMIKGGDTNVLKTIRDDLISGEISNQKAITNDEVLEMARKAAASRGPTASLQRELQEAFPSVPATVTESVTRLSPQLTTDLIPHVSVVGSQTSIDKLATFGLGTLGTTPAVSTMSMPNLETSNLAGNILYHYPSLSTESLLMIQPVPPVPVPSPTPQKGGTEVKPIVVPIVEPVVSVEPMVTPSLRFDLMTMLQTTVSPEPVPTPIPIFPFTNIPIPRGGGGPSEEKEKKKEKGERLPPVRVGTAILTPDLFSAAVSQAITGKATKPKFRRAEIERLRVTGFTRVPTTEIEMLRGSKAFSSKEVLKGLIG